MLARLCFSFSTFSRFTFLGSRKVVAMRDDCSSLLVCNKRGRKRIEVVNTIISMKKVSVMWKRDWENNKMGKVKVVTYWKEKIKIKYKITLESIRWQKSALSWNVTLQSPNAANFEIFRLLLFQCKKENRKK